MEPIDIAAEALRLIAGDRCERLTRGRCCDEHSGYVRSAQYGNQAWCDPCIAFDALARIGNGEPPTVSREQAAVAQRDEALRELEEMRTATRVLGARWGTLANAARSILRLEQEIELAVELARGGGDPAMP